ncbi:MAG TPA: hypothetical protein VFV99_18215 [Kofleriaceae bacterium]|nr:hypothetical protein [Kofleriaceae bacterium]
MLRAALLGLLAVSAVSCKSGGDAPKSQPGVAAGKVVEVTGTVTVRHNDVAQPLAKGATVEGDDIIETGADGNAIIELSHNLARWELGPNKTSKVRESTAWGLAKKSGAVAVVQQDTAAAGRPAERSAADTSVSARADEAAPAPGAAPAPAAAAPPAPEAAPAAAVAPPPPPPAPEKAAAPTRQRSVRGDDGLLDKESGGGGAPPAPPKITTRGGVAKDGVGAGGGGAAKDSGSVGATANITADAAKPMTPAEADKAATDVVLKNEKALKACLTKDAQSVNVTIKVAANGTATAVVSGKAEIPAAVQRCVKAAVGKMAFAKAATTVSMEISR